MQIFTKDVQGKKSRDTTLVFSMDFQGSQRILFYVCILYLYYTNLPPSEEQNYTQCVLCRERNNKQNNHHYYIENKYLLRFARLVYCYDILTILYTFSKSPKCQFTRGCLVLKLRQLIVDVLYPHDFIHNSHIFNKLFTLQPTIHKLRKSNHFVDSLMHV